MEQRASRKRSESVVDQSSAQPKLRSDLVIRQQKQGDASIFVFKDPVTGRFFRFREPEYFIARQLDGLSSLDLVRQRAQEKFGCDLPWETLEQFIATLRRVGLLENEVTQGDRTTSPGRIGGALLYLRFKAFDPDRLLSCLVPKVRFCFTPTFLLVSALTILLAFGITVLNWDEIQRDLRDLWRFDALLLAWLTVLGVTVVHEFAHGLTCKYFGGEVHEMGFMLIYFQPAFYCNVSDAWLFPEKSKRLWVTFAGGYIEIFIWAVATLLWRVIEPQTWISFVAMVVMATSAIKTLFNLNPLIKLDGYYLLSDYLEIPNLRPKSIGYLRARLNQLLGSNTGDATLVSRRERRIYATYGLLAGSYSFWLLGYVALAFGNYLMERYKGMGFALYIGLLATAFQNPLKKTLRGFTTRLVSTTGKNRRLGRRIAGLLLLGVLLLCLWCGRMELKVSGAFGTLPAHNADVRAEVEGIIEQVFVDEGDFVQKGERVARLSDRDYRAQVLQVHAQIQERQATLDTLSVSLARRARHEEAQQLRLAELARARTNLAKLQEEIRYAESELERIKTLFAEGLVSRAVLEKTEEQVVVKQKEAEAAEAELRMISADDHVDLRRELAQAEAVHADIARLETQRRHLEGQLRFVDVLSPASGVVTTPRPKEIVGRLMKKGDLILEVHQMDTLTAEIVVPETEIADVREGQKVILKARALPERSFNGTVTEIASEATEEKTAPGRIVRVRTALDNRSGLLKPGMTGTAKIYCGQRPILDLMTRRMARFLRVEFWSWW